MLMRACDMRLPARLKQADLDFIATALVQAAADVKQPSRDQAEPLLASG
jgi:hypothetical protein